MPDKTYFTDSNKLYDYLPDSLLTTDEFEILQGRIADELRYLDYEDVEEYYLSRGLPFLRSFEISLERKLTGAGFKEEQIMNNEWLKSEAVSRQGDYDNPDTAAAIAALVAIKKLKDLLLSDGKFDKFGIKIFLISLDAIINLFRAGSASELARTEVLKIANSVKTRGLKKHLIMTAIAQIFQEYPNMKKTLGNVWNKIDSLNEKIPVINPKTGEKVSIRTFKNEQGEEFVSTTGSGLNFEPYAKRSLQTFINELK